MTLPAERKKSTRKAVGELFRINPLLRLLAINGIVGLGISAFVVAGLLYTNIGGLYELIMRSENPFIPMILLSGGMMITMTSVVMGSAVMLMKTGADEGRPRSGIKQQAAFPDQESCLLIPVPVKTGTRAR